MRRETVMRPEGRLFPIILTRPGQKDLGALGLGEAPTYESGKGTLSKVD